MSAESPKGVNDGLLPGGDCKRHGSGQASDGTHLKNTTQVMMNQDLKVRKADWGHVPVRILFSLRSSTR